MADEAKLLLEARRRAMLLLETLRRQQGGLEGTVWPGGSDMAGGRKALQDMIDSAARLLQSIDACLRERGIYMDGASHDAEQC